MGLRINTNVSALTALRNLRSNDANQAKSLERLSTGLRINRGADDPSGIIISEQLNRQITGLKQGVENAQNASNLLSTADFVAGQLTDILNQIQSSVTFAANTGGISQDQIDAEQQSVDNAIQSIDRIVNSATFAGRKLLNGASQFKTASAVSSSINNLDIKNVEFADSASSRTFEIKVNTVGARGTITATSAVTTSGVTTTVRITGNRGTQDVTLAARSSNSTIATAINSVADLTGIYASAGGSAQLGLFTSDFGSGSTARIEVISGAVTFAGLSTADFGGLGTNNNLDAGEVLLDRGVNARVELDGKVFIGNGLDFNINTKSINFSFQLDNNTTFAVGNSFSFKVFNGRGLSLQIGDGDPATQINVSLPDLTTANLGSEAIADIIVRAKGNAAPTGSATEGGFLSQLKTGETSSLTNNPTNAAFIAKKALDQVAKSRGFLGGLVANTVEPTIQATEVQIENLGASLSTIRDLDFAEETSAFTKRQILFQSSIAVLASANLVPQSVLALLR
ncbi:MAG: hypothetical protein HY606_08340 [Planctomycetes bacterium]|nr:hypothetical protein [Planctomycetota bacterium]